MEDDTISVGASPHFSGSPPVITTPSSSQVSLRSPAFYVDWDFPSVGIVGRDGHRSESKGDFAIRLDALIEANEKTGYLATVKRAIDDEERQCFFTMESASFRSRFLSNLNNSFGSGLMDGVHGMTSTHPRGGGGTLQPRDTTEAIQLDPQGLMDGDPEHTVQEMASTHPRGGGGTLQPGDTLGAVQLDPQGLMDGDPEYTVQVMTSTLPRGDGGRLRPNTRDTSVAVQLVSSEAHSLMASDPELILEMENQASSATGRKRRAPLSACVQSKKYPKRERKIPKRL